MDVSVCIHCVYAVCIHYVYVLCVYCMHVASAAGCCSCRESKAGDDAGTERHHRGNTVSFFHSFIHYPRRARSALGVDIVLTLDVCLYVCMLAL